MQILDEPSQLLAIFQPLKLDESCTKVGPSNKANTCPDSRPEDHLGNHQHVTCHRFFSPHSPEIWISNDILYHLYENSERERDRFILYIDILLYTLCTMILYTCLLHFYCNTVTTRSSVTITVATIIVILADTTASISVMGGRSHPHVCSQCQKSRKLSAALAH